MMRDHATVLPSAMENDTTLTGDDEGKHVENAKGEEIGLVVAVEHGRAHVEPDPGLSDSIRAKMGWGDADETGTYVLDRSKIKAVTDDGIVLDR